MRKLLFAGAVAAAPLLAWQPAHAAAAAPLNDNIAAAPSASVQKVAWVWVGGRRVWHPGWGYGYGYGYHPWHPGWGYRPGYAYGWHAGWGWHGRWVHGHWG